MSVSRIIYVIAGIVVALGDISELFYGHFLSAFGLALVAAILFSAAFDKPKSKRGASRKESREL